MRRVTLALLGAVVLLSGVALGPGWHSALVSAQADCQRFDQTGHTLCGRFLQYWQQHGGLAQQGYPISEPFSEMSDTDGKIYTVQYFERAVFELHPENASPNDMLLSLLGNFRYQQKYPTGAAKQVPDTLAGSQLFQQTGKRLGGTFLSYWQSHGGLAQQGYPISDEFLETSDTDGKVYKVQYFERAVFEAHPENQAPYDVLLSQLGTFRLHEKYGDGSSLPSAPTAVPFSSGGLGLSREAWEKLHGVGLADHDTWFSYEDGEYLAGFTSNGLVAGLSVGLEQNMSITNARAMSRQLLPNDAQLVKQDEVVGYEDGTVVYDTYFSPSLGTIYPPDTQNIWGASDFWNGAPAGTFTVQYDLASDASDPSNDYTYRLEIFVGRHDYP